MTRDDLANASLRDMQGYDASQGYDPEGPSFGADDPIGRGGLTTLSVSLSVANGASLNLDFLSQAHLDNAALPTGLVSINGTATLAAYKQLLRYFAQNPSRIRSILFQSSEATTAAPLLASLRVTPTRTNPFGFSATNTVLVQAYQTTQDYQGNRLTLPITMVVDTVSYMNLLSDVNASGAAVTMNLTIIIGQRQELRRGVVSARPLVVKPGGRGPAAV